MQLLLCSPLTVRHLVSGKAYELLPVPMAAPIPSRQPELWLRFLRPQGRFVPITSDDAERVQSFMRRHGTEALSDDGEIAWTLAGSRLVECDPSVCDQTHPAEEAQPCC